MLGRWAIKDEAAKAAAFAEFYRDQASQRARAARQANTDDVALTAKEKRTILDGLSKTIVNLAGAYTRPLFGST